MDAWRMCHSDFSGLDAGEAAELSRSFAYHKKTPSYPFTPILNVNVDEAKKNVPGRLLASRRPDAALESGSVGWLDEHQAVCLPFLLLRRVFYYQVVVHVPHLLTSSAHAPL